MANINNSGNNRCWRGCGERGSLLHCWWESTLVQQPPWKIVWRFLKKLKIQSPCNPAIILQGIYPKGYRIPIQRGTCTPTFIAALSTMAKRQKEPSYPTTDEWIKKMWGVYVYTHTHTHTNTHTLEYYSAIEKNEILPSCNYMDGTGGYYAKRN